LPSLELRRPQLDLIYCYKIVFGLVKLNSGDFFEFSSVSHTIEGMRISCTNLDAVKAEYISCLLFVWSY